MATTTAATRLHPKQRNRKKKNKITENRKVNMTEENKMEIEGNWKVADVDYGAIKLDELGHFLGIEELRMDDEVIIGKPTGARNKSRRRKRQQRKISSQLTQNPLKRKDSPLEDDQADDQKRQKMHPSSKSSVLTFDTEKKKTPKDSKKIAKEKRGTKSRRQDKEDGDKPEQDDDEVAAYSEKKKDVAGAQKSKKTSASFTKGIPVIANKNSNISMSAWKNLQIPGPVLQALKDLGFQEPTPIQKATIPLAIQDQKDIIGAAETGSGKTLAFGIPVIHKILQHKAAKEREARANAFKEANMEAVTKKKTASAPKGIKVKELVPLVPKSSRASEKVSTNPPAGQKRNVNRKSSAKMQSKDEEGEMEFREQESDEEGEQEEDLETGDFNFDEEEDDEEDEDIEYDFGDEDEDDEEENIEFEDNGDESEDDGEDYDDLDDDIDEDDDVDNESDESDGDSADNDDEEDDDDSSDDDDSEHQDGNQTKPSKTPQNEHQEKDPKETDQPGEPKKRPKGKKGQTKRRFRIKERKMLELDGAEFEGIELINKMKKRGIGCVRAIDDISEEEMLAQLGSNQTIKTIKADRGASSTDDRQLYALIMTPTRELAVQIKNHLVNITKYTDLQIAVIVGGMSAQKQERVLKKRPEIVIGTPGRIWELFREGEPHLSTMSGVRCLVLDEADRMIEKGHYEELTQIIQQLNHSPASLERQTFVFSATLTLIHLGPDRKIASNQANKKNNPKQEKKDRKAKLNALIKRVGIREDPAIVDLTQKEGTVASLMEAKIISDVTDKDIYLFYFLLHFPGRTLVFTNSIDCIRRLCSILTLLSCSPLPLHSSLHQKQRLKNLDRFAANPKALLIATDVAARGLDIPDVQHVIHYQMPRTSEMYIHRSGRTARQSKEGISVMLVAPTEANFYRRVCKTLNRDDIPSFPVDHSYYNAVKQRVDMARLIDQASHSVAKKKHTNDWFIKAAKDLDIDLDEDLVLHDLGDSHEQLQREKKLYLMKGELKRLLQRDVFPRGSSWRYPTAPGKLMSALTEGQSNAVSMVKNKPGNKFKLDTKEAAVQPKKAKRCRNKFKRAEAEKAP